MKRIIAILAISMFVIGWATSPSKPQHECVAENYRSAGKAWTEAVAKFAPITRDNSAEFRAYNSQLYRDYVIASGCDPDKSYR